MYIPEFWCGVGITLVIEVVAMIVWGLFRKDDK